jgi:branched-chain amino acid transport system substrate-binding protein
VIDALLPQCYTPTSDPVIASFSPIIIDLDRSRGEHSVVRTQLNRGLTMLLGLFLLLGCRASSPIPPTPEPTILEVEIPVTVEVTRVVYQPIVIQATPTPRVPCAPQQAADTPMITIGAVLPLSSPGALHAGFAMQTALNLAVGAVNDKGGIHGTPLRLLTYDSAGIAERGATFAERLILTDCAVGLVGFYHSSVALAVIDVAHRYGTPVVVAEANSDEITARGYPEVFRIAPTGAMLTAMPADWLVSVGDYNGDSILSAVVIGDNVSGNTVHLDRTIQRLRSHHIHAELLTVDLPSSDFTAAIARILALPQLPDAVFIFLKGNPALTLHAQLLDAGIGPQRATLIVTHHAGLETERFWDRVPGGVGTVVARMGPWPGAVTPAGHEFAIRYDQQLGRWPEGYAFAAHDAVVLLAHAMRHSDSLTSPELLAALRTSDLELASGQVRFSVADSPSATGATPDYTYQQWLEPPTLYLQYTQPGQRSGEMIVIWPPTYRTGALSPVFP